MAKKKRTADDLDSPWKDALEQFLAPFLEFFFPHIAAAINWQRGYESLDKEFQQILRKAKTGPAWRTSSSGSGSRMAGKPGC